jgi:competence protein ComEC
MINGLKTNILHQAPLLIPAVCLMAGIVLGSHLMLSIPFCIVLLLAMVIATALLGRWGQLQTIGITLCSVMLGILVIEMDLSKVDDGEPSRIERTQQYFLHQRTLLLQRLQSSGLSDDQYAVVAAMALGEKSALTRELKDTYSKTGASHILALSGLHLGIIYALLSILVIGRRWQTITQVAMILSIWAFVFLVGMSASVVRSAVMLTVYALLALGHRQKMSVNTLAFTAIVMLLVTPKALFDIGFQMSFMAVFSILLFVPLFYRPFSAEYLMTHRVVKWIWGMVAVSVAAQIGVAPLIAYYFGRFSCYFLLTNFIVLPAATLILYLSLGTLLIPSIGVVLASIVGLLNTTLLYISTIPGATIEGLHPSVMLTVSIYGIIFATYYLLWLTIPKTAQF